MPHPDPAHVPLVPTSSTKIGNTKQFSPAKHWCFTVNNYTSTDIKNIVDSPIELVPIYVFQEETGKTGTKHLQGYLMFAVKCRHEYFTNPRIHWGVTRNIKKSKAYCCKQDTRTGKVYARGYFVPVDVKILNKLDLYPWENSVIKILQKEPDDRTIHWIWSNAGALGKTTFCKYLTVKYGALPLCGKGNDVRNGIVSYINENNGKYPRLVVFPIPRSYRSEYLSYEAIENIKDMYFYSGKYEGGIVCGNCPHLFVFANHPPDMSRMSEDRWVVTCIDNGELVKSKVSCLFKLCAEK